MYPGTPSTSSDEYSGGMNALTSKLCFSMTPSRETLTQSVPGTTTAVPRSQEIKEVPTSTDIVESTQRINALTSNLCLSMTPQRETPNESVDNEVQSIITPPAGVSITQELQEVPPATTIVESTRRVNVPSSKLCLNMTPPRETPNDPVDVTTYSESLAPCQTVHIPEFDPQRKNKEMPNWMRFDPSVKDGAKKYRCIICDVRLGSTTQHAKEHESGKKHKNKLYKQSYRLHETVLNLTTLVRQRFDLDLRMITSENISMMPVLMRSMALTKGDIVSVGFVIEDGHIRCLCLVTKTLCVNIDRTVLVEADKLRCMNEFKEVFEGECVIGGIQLWELVLVLYHRYGIRCRSSVDVDNGSGYGAGVDLPLDNYKVHTQVALEAAGCYDLIDGSEKKLRDFHKTPDIVLDHICTLNLHMYGMYREVRRTNLEVIWSNASVKKDGMVVKLQCDDYISRIRKKSVVQLYSGSRVITGRCLEWEGGKLVEIHLESSLEGGVIEKITLNRREEDHVMRVLLRDYVHRLGSKNFIANRFQKHMYRFKTLGMKQEHEIKFRQLVRKSARLNNLQNIAMARGLYPISMIHGPPGTGKTRVLSEIVKNAVLKGYGVICLGWSNVSVRRLCESLRQVLPSTVVGILTSREYKCWHQSEYHHLKDFEVKAPTHQVICMTVCNYLQQTMDAETCNMWCASKQNPTLLTQRRVMITDESSQIWAMVSVLLLSRISGYLSLVAGGDDYQLDPYLHKDIVNAQSFMKWIREFSGEYEIFITQLRRQYRMMPSVGSVVSENFYNNTLVHHKKSDGDEHLFFHCVDGKTRMMGTSPYCEEDSMRCIEILKSYRWSNLDCQVLTFYEAQRKHLKSIDGDVKVCCIDSFQGQEAEVIILLLSVRKRNLSPFMLHRGRLCVGTSRAMKDFHIVGCWDTMCMDASWKKLLRRCRKRYY